MILTQQKQITLNFFVNKQLMKKFLIISILFCLLLILIVSNIKLVEEKNILIDYNLNQLVKEYINKNIDNINNEEELIIFSQETTSKLLKYSYTQNIDNLSFNKQSKAHCVGYSIVCSQICNYIINKKQLNIKCKHVRGYVYLFNYNLHNFFNFILPKNSKIQKFCQDHDFVSLQTEQKKYYFSPDCYDMFGYDFMCKIY